MALFEFRTKIQDISDLPGFVELIMSGSGVRVGKASSMKVAAVYSCVDAISKDLAALPIHVMRKSGKTVEKVPKHPAYERLKLRPNPEMSAFTARRDGMWHALLEGNRYSFIERSMINPVKALWPLDPDAVNAKRVLGSRGGRGRIVYEVQDGYTKRTYEAEDILHLKAYASNGFKGDSVITLFAREQIGIGLEMDRFQANFFKNGANPGGIFEHPKSLGDDEKKRKFYAALKKRYGGNQNSKAPMVLENGMSYKPYEVKMVDQQFLELLKINKADICGIFGVPQSRIGISDSNTNYGNTEQENRRYVRSGLLPWAIPDEQEMDWKLLTEEERKKGFYIKYNFDAFLRGDTKTQAETDEKYWRMGVPINDLLARNDKNPIPGGDVGRVQINTIAITEADNYLTDKNKRSEKRSAGPVEKRALDMIIRGRDRVRTRFEGLIRSAAQKIVNKESLAVKREAQKQLNQRSTTDFDTWIDEFYAAHEGYIADTIGPVLRSYAETMADVVAGEVDADILMDDLSAEIDTYLIGYTRQYLDESIGQLRTILSGGTGLDSIEERMDEWHETRADKVVMDQGVSVMGMVSRTVILGAGYKLVWRNRGKSCPFCQEMEGRVVSKSGEAFIESGTEIDGGEAGKMTVRQTLYAPLHKGCDCVTVAE